MDSTSKLSLHDLLGSGFVADVMLWRKKDVSTALLLGTIASWVTFYCVRGYTILSFLSKVLLILITILFVWAKVAQVLGRSPPPVPMVIVSMDVMKEAVVTIVSFVNKMLMAFEDVALGKDSKLFLKVALALGLISLIGRFTNLVTFGYISLLVALTIPPLVERHMDCIATSMKQATANMQAHQLVFKGYYYTFKKWILETEKLS